ncbi:hypothetical protein [Rhizobium sp. C4]|uniref:hypothetical protein n=1 Tax=Rhizobium sp. C4 TaxID=1349800 RepID=UPI001E2BF7D8|nr:hypothetical protein [Rhizobium sp. C4]MCD2173378.1 hypothetical protein [Rhizobium sp. C4]
MDDLVIQPAEIATDQMSERNVVINVEYARIHIHSSSIQPIGETFGNPASVLSRREKSEKYKKQTADSLTDIRIQIADLKSTRLLQRKVFLAVSLAIQQLQASQPE